MNFPEGLGFLHGGQLLQVGGLRFSPIGEIHGAYVGEVFAFRVTSPPTDDLLSSLECRVVRPVPLEDATRPAVYPTGVLVRVRAR